MDGNNLLKRIHKFGLTAEDICRNTLGVDIGQIRETVLLSPGWVPERLFSAAEIEECVSASPLFQYKIWDVRRGGRCATYVRCGFGAPVVMDAVLLFGLTGRCKRMLFVSSVGAVSEEMEIGDLLAPEYSAAGDGAGRYLEEDFLRDTFGERQYTLSGSCLHGLWMRRARPAMSIPSAFTLGGRSAPIRLRRSLAI